MRNIEKGNSKTERAQTERERCIFEDRLKKAVTLYARRLIFYKIISPIPVEELFKMLNFIAVSYNQELHS